MDKDNYFEFVKKWLSAWTGNKPDLLIEFYAEDAYYSDPEHRDGLQGRDEIFSYFKRLLDVYREWVWRPIEVFPTEHGFIVKWECTIPVGSRVIHELGVDIIELKDGKIARNEVYFDRTRLIRAVEELKKQERIIH